MKVKDIATIEELRAIASDVLFLCKPKKTASVITLHGDLGAGKTAFTKELASLLGISDTVTSPTFVIMKSYAISEHSHFKTLIHIDAYRIESDDEMRVLGFADILKDPSHIVCIEWPEKINALIPKDAYPISLSLHGTTRTITYGN